jgi:excisionase family DNA binding protein
MAEVSTVEEFSKKWKVSRSWTYRAIAAGRLPHVVLPGGRLIRIPDSAALGVFESKKTSPTEDEFVGAR